MPMPPAPLATVADALRAGRRELHDYLDDLCTRLEVEDARIEAFLPEPNRRARLLAEAAALAARFPLPADRPPLWGVPIGVKDIFGVDGFPTAAGSRLPPELFAGPEATVVQSLRTAGALILGKTVTTEFAAAEPGPTRNPHAPDHTPGGSSSGSAAAVAAGFCPLALGSQTIGSVIRPAAFCGIVGVKPSYGRIPLDGVLPYAPSVDHVGFFTPDVAGARLVASLLCRDWAPERQTDLAPTLPTLGVPDGPYLAQAEPAGVAAFEAQLARLQGAGYPVRRVPLFADLEAISRRHQQLTTAELAQTHTGWFAAHEARYRPRTAALIRAGQTVRAEELAAARAGRGALRAEVEGTMAAAGIDLWVSPAAPGPAPRGLDSTGSWVMNLPWTYAGLPAISLPAGQAEGGLPLGLQVVARSSADEALLAWAEPLAAALSGDGGAPT